MSHHLVRCAGTVSVGPAVAVTHGPATARSVGAEGDRGRGYAGPGAGGLLVIVFGLVSVVLAVGMGWAGAAVLGVVLLTVGWRVPTSVSAHMLRYLIAGWGVISLIGAVFALVS